MRIVVVINALTTGGAQDFALSAVKAFHDRGDKLLVIAFRGGAYEPFLLENGISFELLGEKYLDIPSFFKLLRLLTEFKPDIIHSHLYRATLLSRFAAKILDIPHIVSIHGKESKLYETVESLTRKDSDYFFFSSDYLRQAYFTTSSFLPDNKYEVTYPGVFIENISAVSPERAGEPFTFGTLSRLHKVKGLDILIKACSILKERGYVFRCVIAGEGKELASLKDLVADLKLQENCFFAGHVSEKTAFLKSLDLLVSPSRDEGFGINICEAILSGVPVAASDLGGIKEIISDRKTGLLFEPLPLPMAETLIFALENKSFLPHIVDEAFRVLVEKFDREKSIKRIREVYVAMTDKKYNVHFAISSKELGGGERLALGLIKALVNDGRFNVSATCQGEPLKSALEAVGAEVSAVSGKAGGIFFLLRLLTDILRFSPDIISAHLNRAALFSSLAGKMTATPVLAHIHGLNKKSYYENCDHLIAVSDAIKKHMEQQGGAAAKITVIKNCIDKLPVGFKNLKKDKLDISITAKLHKNKGHEWALKAIESDDVLLDKINKIHILGSGSEEKYLKELFSTGPLADKLIFHGFVTDPDTILKDMDVALLPSLGEGIPLSLLEAMRFGIPCVATDVGGVKEIVEDSISGFLVPSENTEALRKSLLEISKPEVYNELSKGAFESFKKLNDYSAMLESFKEILLKLSE